MVGRLINPPKQLPQLPRLLPKPKHPLVEKIMKLPPEKRIHFFNRFEACGELSSGKSLLLSHPRVAPPTGAKGMTPKGACCP
ncbi:MAG: hypothetical protein AAB306_05655, partial [Pseudomonadota bacterium]